MKWVVNILFLLSFVLQVSITKAQVFENDAADREKLFIYKIKEIDEFFERFNDDSASFIRGIYKQKGVKFRVKRADLIRSLFNVVGHQWRSSQLDSFVRKALNAQMPSTGRYYNDDWFAEAICMFEYKGKTLSVPVILKKKTDINGASKWLVAGVRQDFIAPDGERIAGGDSPAEGRFISPVSHGVNFIDLGRAFNDKEHLFCYFDSAFVKKPDAVTFYNTILKDQIKFLYVHEIKYHFLQVSNYVFTVENFQRAALNSGWLINRLLTVTPAEKENFKHNLLGK